MVKPLPTTTSQGEPTGDVVNMQRGRPPKKIPRTKQINMKMTLDERKRFKHACVEHDLDYVDMIMKALNTLDFDPNAGESFHKLENLRAQLDPNLSLSDFVDDLIEVYVSFKGTPEG